MARRRNSDSGRLKRAHKKWQELKEAESFSAPQGSKFGIVVSSDWDGETEDNSHEKRNHDIYMAEAEELTLRLRADGGEATLTYVDTTEDIDRMVGDRAISDLVFIGDGTLGNFAVDPDVDFSWWDMSRSTDHLKQGIILQRYCGVRWLNMNVAMGTFAVSDMRNVYAPVGEYFLPESLDDALTNALLGPVYGAEEVSYQGLLSIGRIQDLRAQDEEV